GNGIDPVDIIESHGADALRFTLAGAATETQDLRMPVEPVTDAEGRVAIRRAPGGPMEFVPPAEAKAQPKDRRVNTSERFEQGRTFPNKFWNASRFALMNLQGYEPAAVDAAALEIEDRWILSLLAQTAAEATAELGAFRFAEATKRLRDFTWNDFCDWYVEILKGRLRDPAARPRAQRVLAAVLDGLCRLLHPVLPFVTEGVWQALGEVAPRRGLPEPGPAAESVCIAPWPAYPQAWRDAEAEAVVAQWQEKITAIRNLKAERNVPKDARIAPIIVAAGPAAEALRRGEPLLRGLTGAASVTIVAEADRPPHSAVTVLADAEVILPLEGLIDRQTEVARNRKALAEIDRQLGAVRAKLGNESFLVRAPAELVAQQRAREGELLAQREAVVALLAQE
ncbi:MAG TPA: class I tRNA ligase family protein, partial [Isosphaeraceae bacterium]